MEMWTLAADLGLSVVERRGPHRSGYAPGDNTIRLTPGMRGRVVRSVLAHEIAHHLLGHQPTDSPAMRERQERAANAWAARTLINREQYAVAEQLRDGHVTAIACDLNVSDELVLVYRSMLFRTETTLYIDPRMGAGQFAHRTFVA